ncbi:MAG: metallophosphoesterase [Parcubacteria group bacterium]|jgi:3',5'-cyclic AMP phosphodiesterase CpdA
MIPSLASAEKIGWVTDIHAGNAEKKKKSKINVFYPRYFRKYFLEVSRELKSQGIKTLVISGDSTDYGKQVRYAKRIRSIARRNGLELIWARGNHDDKSLVKRFMKTEENYYYLDRYGWRIVVLDTSEKLAAVTGGMGPAQKNWAEDLIEDTEEPILVVMHHPIFDKQDSDIYESYRDMESAFSNDGKVEIVLAGHWHFEFSKKYRKVRYAIGNPLTLGSKLGSYYIIDLDKKKIESFQAQIEKLEK